MENLQTGCARCRLIVVIAPRERGIAELQGRHMNDIPDEQETVLVRGKGVAGMTGSMAGQVDRRQPLCHPVSIANGFQKGPELRKIRLGAETVYGRLGN